MRGVRWVAQNICNLLFPGACLVCRRQTVTSQTPEICHQCWSAVPLIQGPACPQCGRPFASGTALSHSPDHRCGECRVMPPHYDQARSMAVYEGTLAEAIKLFKYSGKTHWSKPLARLLMRKIYCFDRIDVVLPVPLHPKRLREREFNQSLLLAREVSCPLRLPLQIDNLYRLRNTPSQIAFSQNRRRKNVRGAFGVRSSESLHGRVVLLIDDVFTTGSTVSECARVLKQAGAGRVNVLTVARMLSADIAAVASSGGS